MKVNVIGLGYIGLPTALMLASHGVTVVGTDHDQKRITALNAGNPTFEEEGLDKLFQDAQEAGIRFTTEYIAADVYIISVPTPYNRFTQKMDAHYLISAIRSVLKACKTGTTIVVESTITPGTIDNIVCPIIEAAGFVVGQDIYLAHAPERIIPGQMIYELLHNDRTIGADPDTGERIKELYSSFCKGEITITSIKAAEMTKVVENTFRAVNIAFANELSKICRYNGLDVYEIIRVCNMHPRVNILQPGPGVGGHCIPVDPWFLVGEYPNLTKMIRESLFVNESMPEFVVTRIYELMRDHGMTDISRIGLYGLTYKEDVDDCRESPTLQMLNYQKKHLSQPIKVYDPFVKHNIVENQYHELEQFLNDVDLVVIMVAHREIKNRANLLNGKIILDTRNVLHLPNTYTL